MTGVSGWLRHPGVAVAGLLSVALPFAAFTRMILFHFYLRGSFLLDSGLLAFLIWRSDPVLTQPASFGGGSFFATHVTPLFLLTSALSRALPFSMPQFFAGFVGASHALLALAVFWVLAGGFRLRRGAWPFLAALAALGFAFSGLALAIARNPHFETLIAAFFLLFAAARALGHTRLAVLCFGLGLLTREDAGFHYVAVLALTILLDAVNGMTWRRQREALGFAAAGLAYSCAAMALQHVVFPGPSAFARVYLGDPPFGQLNAAEIRYRLLYFAASRPYIWLPGLAAGVWAVLARNPYVIVGYVACVPWLLLQLAANIPLAAAVASYYAFPVLIAMAWPLFGVLHQRQLQGRSGNQLWALAGFGAMLAVSFIPGADLHDPGRLRLPDAFLRAPDLAEQAATDRAVAAISAARPEIGRLFIDNSVAAIAPDDFTPAELPDWPATGPGSVPDAVAFMAEGYDAKTLREIAERTGLTRHYRVPGTNLHLAARRSLEDVPALAGHVAAE